MVVHLKWFVKVIHILFSYCRYGTLHPSGGYIMDLLLDSADLSEIQYGLDYYPIKGVTTNPTMLSRVASSNLVSHLYEIRKLIGDERDLHVQVMGSTVETMLAEGHRIHSVLGEHTYVAVPVTQLGLKAIRILVEEGIKITASTVFSTIQGILAMQSGARYIAVFYDRMLNLDIDAPKVIKELASLLWTNTSATQVLAASFRNVAEVTSAYSSGAGCCTVKLDLLRTSLGMPSIAKAVSDFSNDWQRIYGSKTLLDF